MNELEQLVLRPGRKKVLGLLLVCLVFAAGGAVMIGSGQRIGWFVLAPSVLCAGVFLVTMLPNASYLKIDAKGFTMCSLFRAKTFAWSDVDLFGVGWIGGNEMVVFNFSSEFEGYPVARKFAAAISGVEGALPDTYGMKAEELAVFLNDCRDRALARPTG